MTELYVFLQFLLKYLFGMATIVVAYLYSASKGHTDRVESYLLAGLFLLVLIYAHHDNLKLK